MQTIDDGVRVHVETLSHDNNGEILTKPTFLVIGLVTEATEWLSTDLNHLRLCFETRFQVPEA